MNRLAVSVLVYVVCSVLIAGYLFTQLPSAEVSGCTPSAEDLERERMERITSPPFLVLCVMAVLNGIILIWAWRAMVKVEGHKA